MNVERKRMVDTAGLGEAYFEPRLGKEHLPAAKGRSTKEKPAAGVRMTARRPKIGVERREYHTGNRRDCRGRTEKKLITRGGKRNGKKGMTVEEQRLGSRQKADADRCGDTVFTVKDATGRKL